MTRARAADKGHGNGRPLSKPYAWRGGKDSEAPAATLRRAAALMRERAAAATPGPWQHMCLGSEACMVLRTNGTPRDRGRGRVARFGQKEWKADHADADHVMGMHPGVALAVADWLDETAGHADSGCQCPRVQHALSVARAYLGGDDQ